MSDTPRCPRCGSTNTGTSVDYKIKKGLGYAAEFGIGFLAGRFFGEAGADMVEDVSIADGVDKEWQCNDCGHIWRGIANASHSSYTQLGTAKPQNSSKYQKQQIYTAPKTQNKIYNKQDRAELLKIIYKCDGRGGGWNDELACIKNAEHLHSELQKYSINISKSKMNSINSYRRLADIILDNGWTRSKQLVSNKPKEDAASTSEPQEKKYNKQDRETLLKIIYKCDGRNEDWNDEYSFIQDVEHLYSELQKSSIRISKSKVYSINSYKKLADIILDSGWTCAKYIVSRNPQNTTLLKIVNGLGEEIEVVASNDPKGLRNLPFRMKVEDCFHIEGRGDVVAGRIEKGYITIGEKIAFNNNPQNTAIVVGIEIFRQLQQYAEFEDNVGLLLRDNGKINKGDILTKLQETEQKNSSQDNVRTDTSSDNTNENEYLEELKECLADGEIGASERRLLNKLRVKLGISEERAEELEASLQKLQLTEEEQEYLEAYQDAMEDGIISGKERRLLDKLMKINNISEERAKEIEMLNN